MHWVRIQWKCYAFLNMVNQSKISTSIPSSHHVRIGFCYLKANGIARRASCIDSAQRFARNLVQPRYICPSTRLSPRVETCQPRYNWANRDTTVRQRGSRHGFAVIGDSVAFIHPTYETRLSPRSLAHKNTLTVADV